MYLVSGFILQLVDELCNCVIFTPFPFHIAFLDNFPPTIVSQSNVINVTLNRIVKLNVTAKDNDTITFRVIDEPADATHNQIGKVLYFTWTVTSRQKVAYKLFSVVNVEDNKGQV